MAKLSFQNGPIAGTELELDRQLLVGRGPLVDLSLDEPTVSRRHVLLYRVSQDWLVEDQRSGNGTRLNGKRLREPTLLADGDVLQFGAVKALFQSPPDPVSASYRSLTVSEEHALPSVVMTMAADSTAVIRVAATQRLKVLEGRLSLVEALARRMSQGSDATSLMVAALDGLLGVLPQAERGIVLLGDPATSELEPAVTRDRDGAGGEIRVSKRLLALVAERREAVLTADAQSDARLASARTLRQLELRSLICVPLLVDDELLGVLQLDNSEREGRRFEPADLALVVGVGANLALALANLRLRAKMMEQELLRHDMALARRIQQRFLPRQPPSLSNLELTVEYAPRFEIGGDFYDFLPLPDGRLGLVIGDVSGKGVSAALFMARLTAELRYRSSTGRGPADVLRAADAGLAADVEEGMFATLQLVAIDPPSGACTIANAGHLPPVVRRAGGRAELLEVPRGVPLGLGAGTKIAQVDFRLGPGEVLVLYTDGVIEAESSSAGLFGEARLCATVAPANDTAGEVQTAVLEALRTFLGADSLSDDLTLITCGRLPLERQKAAPQPRVTVPVIRGS